MFNSTADRNFLHFPPRKNNENRNKTSITHHHLKGCAMCCLNHETHLFVAIGADFIIPQTEYGYEFFLFSNIIDDKNFFHVLLAQVFAHYFRNITVLYLHFNLCLCVAPMRQFEREWEIFNYIAIKSCF